jgi:peptide/nickel transport system ATP-binding protein
LLQNNKDIILELKGLKTQFFTEAGAVKAVDDVSLVVKRRIIAGEIIFDNEDLLLLPEKRMMDIRGNRIS